MGRTRSVRISYDPEGDILYVTFGSPTSATGYQLSDQLLLRIDPLTQEATGLTIFNFSVHASSEGEIAVRGHDDDSEVRPILISVLTSPPVSQFLRIEESEDGVGAYLLSPSPREAVTV